MVLEAPKIKLLCMRHTSACTYLGFVVGLSSWTSPNKGNVVAVMRIIDLIA
jgi:hypothetical protein